jgi:hypothetical protein
LTITDYNPIILKAAIGETSSNVVKRIIEENLERRGFRVSYRKKILCCGGGGGVGKKVVPVDLSDVTFINRSGLTQTQVGGDRDVAGCGKGRGVNVRNEILGSENVPAVS